MDNAIIDTKKLFEGAELAIETISKNLKELCPDLTLHDFNVYATFDCDDNSRLMIAADWSEYSKASFKLNIINMEDKTKLLDRTGENTCQ